MKDSSILEERLISCGSLKKRTNKVIEYTFKEDYILDVDDIVELANTVTELCNGVKHGMLVHTAHHNGTTVEARKMSMKQLKKNDNAIAEALIIKSLPTRIAADFFYRIYRPSHPCKFFKTKEKAEQWLLQQVEIYNQKQD